MGRSPKQGEGGSPTFSPGTDAGRVCPKALHDAEPTKHTQPFTGERGLGIGIINQKFISKTYFFYNLQYAPRFEVRIAVCRKIEITAQTITTKSGTASAMPL